MQGSVSELSASEAKTGFDSSQVPPVSSLTWKFPESRNMGELASPGPQERVLLTQESCEVVTKHSHQI